MWKVWKQPPKQELLSILQRLQHQRKAKFYADEDIEDGAVTILKECRLNITSARELGHRGKPDSFHAAYAFKKQRFLLTSARDGKPASLNNTLNRIVKPALKRCQICRKTAIGHTKADHEFRRDESLPVWHGWHAFRRGLATNLHDLGVDDKTIQAILRHSDVGTTLRYYVKALPKQSQAAMEHLENAVR